MPLSASDAEDDDDLEETLSFLSGRKALVPFFL